MLTWIIIIALAIVAANFVLPLLVGFIVVVVTAIAHIFKMFDKD